MKQKRPYLLRALYEWIVDSELTPYVLVNVDSPDIVVPQDFVEDGRIVLNISPMAVRALSIENETLTFSGRFSGQPFNVFVPMKSVAAIYAKESGDGMMFEPEYDVASSSSSGTTSELESDLDANFAGRDAPHSLQKPSQERGGHLKVIK